MCFTVVLNLICVHVNMNACRCTNMHKWILWDIYEYYGCGMLYRARMLTSGIILL